MIVDSLATASLYCSVHPRLSAAFEYLLSTNLAALAPGKYEIDSANVFAIVQEYDTLHSAAEQMESHRKYIDVQYMVSGEEQVGHAILNSQLASKEYSPDEDYMLYADTPDFFSKLSAGMFMIFFPHDLHMPCIQVNGPARVKKVVVKILAE
ncbi:MAG: YhcH/YjgK/YiaL family protein [Bacteroidota bacterium]